MYALTWGHLRFEHVHGDNINDHHPDGQIEHIVGILDEGYTADALVLKLTPVRVRTA